MHRTTRRHRPMLSVGTLFTVFTVNFLTLGVVWAYVATSYPNLYAARYWTAASFIAALGTSISVLRVVVIVEPWVPALIGNGLLLTSSSLAAMGVNRFYGAPRNGACNSPSSPQRSRPWRCSCSGTTVSPPAS